jgi:hypothetical protein
MFEQALTVTHTLPEADRGALISRLDYVRTISDQFGYGVGVAMDSMFARSMKRRR